MHEQGSVGSVSLGEQAGTGLGLGDGTGLGLGGGGGGGGDFLGLGTGDGLGLGMGLWPGLGLGAGDSLGLGGLGLGGLGAGFGLGTGTGLGKGAGTGPAQGEGEWSLTPGTCNPQLIFHPVMSASRYHVRDYCHVGQVRTGPPHSPLRVFVKVEGAWKASWYMPHWPMPPLALPVICTRI